VDSPHQIQIAKSFLTIVFPKSKVGNASSEMTLNKEKVSAVKINSFEC
jgi:hypothetical protein